MPHLIFDPQWAIARLETEVRAFQDVKGSVDFARAAADLRRTPAAFVITASARAPENRTGTEVTQQLVAETFGVVIAAQNLRDARGEESSKDLRALRLAVLTALHGWQPYEGFDPCEYVSGQLLGMNDYTLWWQDNFITRTIVRST
jgi:hypothetical protein